jgi:hypothetical protein
MNITPNTFEVRALEDGKCAVFVDGEQIAIYAVEADALSDCARLQQQDPE